MDDDYLPGMEAPMQTFWEWWFSLSADDQLDITRSFVGSKGLDDELDEFRRNVWRNWKP